jgi:hypothetical protein
MFKAITRWGKEQTSRNSLAGLLDLPDGQEIGSGSGSCAEAGMADRVALGTIVMGTVGLAEQHFQGLVDAHRSFGPDIADITIFIILNRAVALSAAPTRFILPTFSVP